MKPLKLLRVLLLHAFVSWTFVQFVNSFPTFDKTDKSFLKTNSDGNLRKRHSRAITVYDQLLWPNGEIPYDFYDDTFSVETKCLLEKAMYHIMWNSCIRFRIKSQNDAYLVYFRKDVSICSTRPNSIYTEIKLTPDCFNMETILHLLMHSIGFLDEIKNNDYAFAKVSTPYDIDSIMRPMGDDVLAPKQPNIKFKGLSKLDVEALNKLYECHNPLRLSYDFIRQFVEHYHRCVGKIYNDINRNNALDRVTLKSNQKRSISANEIDETILQGDILVRVNKQPAFPDGNIQASAINPATSLPFSNITTWTDGIIPFDLDSSLEAHKCLIENAMLQIMLNTCIRFRPRNDKDTFYVRIFQDRRYSSCYGSIGMSRELRVSRISLPRGCLDIGTVVHELLHVIGFYHHQNRQDRDQHLKIHDENIVPDAIENFNLNDPLVEQIFTPWDYDSVMLYGEKFFSKDKRSITMEPTEPGVLMNDVFDKPGLSRLDALAINRLYKCPNVSNSHFYYDLSLMKPMLKLVKSCNSSNPENFKSYLYIFK